MTYMYRQIPTDARFAATGPMTRDEMNEVLGDLEDLMNGFTASGTFRSTADYVITFDGTDYYASSAYQTVYGGPDDTGGVDGALFSDVINECLQDISDAGGGTILLDGEEFTATKQILIPDTLTANGGQERCIEIRGTGGTVIKVDETLEAHAIYLDSATEYHMIRFVGFDVWHHNKDENYYSIYIKDARQVLLEDVIVGWAGLCIDTCQVLYLNNFQAVDCPNEGLKINGCSYGWASNVFIDNCGGNPLIAGYNGVLIQGSSKLHFRNFHLYGEKGNFGGQEYGLYLYNCHSSTFSGFYVEGFKDPAVCVNGCYDMSFSDFKISDCAGHSFDITTDATYATTNINLSNFTIIAATAAMEGIVIYSQSGKDITNVQISNGVITSADDGIVISDDTNGGVCTDISVCNVRISAVSHGIIEADSTDYCVYTAINARDCPDGIYMAGAHSKLQGSWNYTTWVPSTAA